jgi:hypothetical protein
MSCFWPFSWAIRYYWLTTLKCRKALVFHNITPPEFFEEGQAFDRSSPFAPAACALCLAR